MDFLFFYLFFGVDAGVHCLMKATGVGAAH